MNIKISTLVNQNYQKVSEGFNRDLFLALKPPLLPLQLLRFDGCKTGDEVHIQLGAGFLKTRWDAIIIDDAISEQEIYFVDEGKALPPILRKWKHKHRMLNKGAQTEIIDDITYHTSSKLMDYLIYPIMYLQFWMRKPVYKKIFNQK